jgi:cysteine desulfurase/selenocysteine lyase
MKKCFPIFLEKKDAKELIYLDSAATTHKPASVINEIFKFYSKEYSTVHRGLYEYASLATKQLEQVREMVANFIGANSDEVIFTHSATEGVNLIAYSYGEKMLKQGDEVLVGIAEHHSNYLPWKRLCEKKEAIFKTIPICTDGTICIESYKKLLSDKVKIVAISHQSNVLGLINPIKEMAELAHAVGAAIAVDGAQMIAHEKVDVKELDVDFYVFSAHKMYGPTGVGILYGKYATLDQMDPFHVGGGMVELIDGSVITYRRPPHKFEAGTPMIAAVMGLGAAITWLNEIGLDHIKKHEQELSFRLYDGLKDEVRFITPLCRGSSILSFTISGVHPSDASVWLSLENISIRSGNMCAQPLLKAINLSNVIRVSLGIYNDINDIDAFIEAVKSLNSSYVRSI